MICSVNEVEGLGTRAARGAGAPPAQARAFGRALAVYLGQGRDEATIRAALERLPGGPIMTLPLKRFGAAGPDGWDQLAGCYDARVPASARVPLSDELHAQLSGLAARTYVPATEGSRLSGAGAGLTDND